ncbi:MULTISPECIES: hypothetical protein [unclassified Flavobacterium]|uniref:hypothetical protein n=1 Tax=unclassified Flavobacterium TaxID=196869 RepID=UPI00131D937A|nr:hypothetical protein [Flavobacterium sp. I-STPP5a]
MAKNIFSLSFVLPSQKLSIRETVFKLLSLLEILRIEDDVFTKFKVSALHFKSVALNLEEGSFEENVMKLSEVILQFNFEDIRQHEKEENPTIDFSRDFGYRFLFQFNKNNKQHFSITGNISSSQFCGLGIEYFPFENSDYDFDWYMNIIRKTNDFLKPKYSSVKIILDQYMELYHPLKIMYPLGWITYFSNDSNIKISEKTDFEIIQEENGQYVIATREDFTTNKENFFAIKEKLIEGMKVLKSTCNEYSDPTRS